MYYYGSTKEDAAKVGFDDVFILQALKSGQSEKCEKKSLLSEKAKQVFEVYLKKVEDGKTSLY